MQAIKDYFQFKVEQVRQVLFNDHFLLWLEVAEDAEEAKHCTEVEKIGGIRAAVNMVANVLLGLVLVPAAEDRLSI
jgi:predicted SAM-dependent methyltransferase